MSPSRINAPLLSGGNALRPNPSEVLKPCSKAGLCTKLNFRSRSASSMRAALSKARDHDDRVGAARNSSFGGAGDDGLVLDRLQQLVARRRARGTPRRKHDGRDLRAHEGAPPLPRCTAIISAMIERAISAAPCAPISRPMGREFARRHPETRRPEAAAPRVWHGSSGSPARRHKTRRKRALRSAPDRQSSGHGSAQSVLCGHPGRSWAAPRRAIRARSPPRRSVCRWRTRCAVDDRHLVAQCACHRRQRLRHMHGADDDQTDRRIEHVDEDLAIALRQRHAAVAAKRLVQRRRQIGSHVARRVARLRAPLPRCVTSATFRRAATSPISRGSTK